MTRITLYEHPLSAAEPRVIEVDNLAEWLLQQYDTVPRVSFQVFAGEPSAETEITQDITAMVRSDQPHYTVLQSPGGFDPITWFVIGVVLSVAVMLLIPKPEMPGNINRTQASPNNALASRENKVRMLERVEDIYGTVKSIPSLMMPTYNKYAGHQKYEFGYYCIGRGYYTVAELRDADTLIADIPGASAAVYGPFTSPNSGSPTTTIGAAIADPIITAARAVEVDGITLKAANQVTLPASAVYTFTPNVLGGTITQATKEPNFSAILSPGDLVTVTMTAVEETVSSGTDYDGTAVTTVSITVTAVSRTLTDTLGGSAFANIAVGDSITLAGFLSGGNNGAFTVATRASANVVTLTAGTMVNEAGTGITLTVERDYSGEYEVLTVSDGVVQLTPDSTSTWTSTATDITCSVQGPADSEYSAWVTLPDLDRTQIWVNVTAPNGMYKDKGGKISTTVAFEIEIEQLDPNTLLPLGVPVVETITGSLSGQVTEERAITVEQTTAWTGPARVRMHRTTAFDYEFDGTVIDEIKWTDLYSVTPVGTLQFGNKTTVHTVTQATARATAVKTRQLNCLASRLLPTYNGSAFSATLDATGLLTSGTLYATSKLVDIIAAVATDPKIGARVLATDVDMAQIYAVQQALDAWSADAGQFNYTFDSDNTSFEETVVTIANAGFCVAYRQNGKIRLAFDRAQATSSALFTHRNKKPHSESITRAFASDADYDGVQLVYVDPDSATSETITLPLDQSATKYKKLEIPGIRNYTQAWYRANREYAKLRGQRITLETTTTLDARSLLPNARIDVVDNTRFKSYDGEVIAQSGMELTLSQPVAFTPAAAHSIVLMRRDGSLQSIACTAGSAVNKVILASLPTEAIVTAYGQDGIRTIFSFAADSARGSMAYLVQELDITDSQYVTLRAINYSADYYAADLEAVPARATVIN